MGKKLKLLEEDGEIKINEEFAHRYEHNKKREDLHRLEELKKRGVVKDSDDSETSSDEEDVVTASKKKDDLKFLDALIKYKIQDDSLKSKDAKFFSSDSENEDDNSNENGGSNDKKEEKKKRMYLKDVIAQQLIEGGAEFEDEEDDSDVEGNKVKSYFQEQEDARLEILKALKEAENEESEGGELLKLKVREGQKDDEDDEVIVEKLDEYFGGDDELVDPNEKFLKNYFKNRMWEGNDGAGIGNNGEEDSFELSDDEEEIEKQEDYERGFNFRFEENVTDRVQGHSRKVEGSVRKKTNTRQLQRDRKEERIAQADIERKEELKRLKNLKKKEMNEKLMKIRETAGIVEGGVCPLDEDDLEEEFDPDEHDRKMKQAFGDEYYEAEDVNPEFGSDDDEDGNEKPDFDKEDELLGLPEGWDDVKGSGDGFMSVRERILKMKAESGGDDEEAEGEEDEVREGGKRKRKKRKPSEVEKAVREELMEEYYKLDYEDTIGDIKTRFRYKPVKAKSFGLKTEEVLMMDDNELNQFVSIKKLAPYREKEWKVPHAKLQQQKEKNKELLRGGTSGVVKGGKRKRRDDDQKTTREVSAEENQKEKTEDVSADANKLSRGSRKRQRQAELKRRQMAYGLIPSQPKSKK